MKVEATYAVTVGWYGQYQSGPGAYFCKTLREAKSLWTMLRQHSIQSTIAGPNGIIYDAKGKIK